MGEHAIRLDEANACHDADPARGAELLRTIDAAQLAPERWPSYAFLLNHVFGEKLLRWDEALQHHRRLLILAQPAPPLVLWRQAATAARLAGDAELADDMAQSFAQASGAPPVRCVEVLQLSAAMFQAPGLDATSAGECALAALAPLADPAWHTPNPLDASVAALTLLDANDAAHTEDVDRAFIELERGHTCSRLGLADEADVARRSAQALAGRFDDAGLTAWFEARAAALRASPLL